MGIICPDCLRLSFSCKSLYLCPSCSRKRTILFAEHVTNKVLLKLPHRQFVFTMPKAVRPFFRHDRRLFADVSRLIYRILEEFYGEAAGRPLLSGMVIAHQTFGDILRAGRPRGTRTSMPSFSRVALMMKERSSTSRSPDSNL